MYEAFNPLREIDWRYRRALTLVVKKRQASKFRDDKYVVQAKRFLTNWNDLSGEERFCLYPENPGLYHALEIHESADARYRTLLEARILARTDFEEIARHSCTMPEAIEWYERLFFNVTDRLDARDYIQRAVIWPAYLNSSGSDCYDGSCKLFGYFGGPVLVDSLTHLVRIDDKPENISKINEYLERQYIHGITRATAVNVQTMEVNKFNITQLFAIHNNLMDLRTKAEAIDTNKTDLEKMAGAVLGELSFVAGLSVLQQKQTEVIDKFKTTHAELRADELLKLSAGIPVEGISDLETFVIPPPRVGHE